MSYPRPTIENEMSEERNLFSDWRQVAKVLKPGDLIEFKRTSSSVLNFFTHGYNHWAIFHTKANGKAMCYDIGPKACGSSGSSSGSLGSSSGGTAVVRYISLKDICYESPDVYSLCRINNLEKKMNELDHPRAKWPSLDSVFAKLEGMVGDELDYHLTGQNCEKYCTGWKYNKEWSGQSEATWDISGNVKKFFSKIF